MKRKESCSSGGKKKDRKKKNVHCKAKIYLYNVLLKNKSSMDG